MDGVDGGDEEAEDADDRVSGNESPVESDDSSIDDKPRVNNYFVTPGAAASGRIVKGGAHTKTVAHTVSGQIAKPNGTGGVKGTGSLGKAKGKVGSKAKAKAGAPRPKPTAAGQEVLNAGDHEFGFIPFVIGVVEPDGLAFIVFGPEFFTQPVAVVLNNGVRGIKNVGG